MFCSVWGFTLYCTPARETNNDPFIDALVRANLSLRSLASRANICFKNIKFSRGNYQLIVPRQKYTLHTTQENSAFGAPWLASSELLKQLYSPLSIKWRATNNIDYFSVNFRSLSSSWCYFFFQMIWYILKQIFTSASVKVVDIYLTASWLDKYPPLFTSTLVNNC